MDRSRFLLLSVLATGGFALSGCVAGMAASAAGTAVRAATQRPNVRDDRRATASAACQARAAGLGQVRVIDAEQRIDGRVTVWGTVESGGVRKSFKCGYDGKVTDFKLRAIPTK
jgi:osmotically-inducible protein OsmY